MIMITKPWLWLWLWLHDYMQQWNVFLNVFFQTLESENELLHLININFSNNSSLKWHLSGRYTFPAMEKICLNGALEAETWRYRQASLKIVDRSVGGISRISVDQHLQVGRDYQNILLPVKVDSQCQKISLVLEYSTLNDCINNYFWPFG